MTRRDVDPTPLPATPDALERIVERGPDPTGPFELWRLRAGCAVGTAFALSTSDGAEFGWPPGLLAATLEGGGFVAEAGSAGSRYVRARTLADLVGADLDVLMVGLNPSLVAADAGVGFAGATNRFWPAALDAGLVSVDRDPLHAFTHHAMGMSDLVKRATKAASELRAADYHHGIGRLEHTVSWLAPRVVCVVGVTGWRAAMRDKHAEIGFQHEPFGGRPVYVMPNPSGLNAHVTRADLAEHFCIVMRRAADER